MVKKLIFVLVTVSFLACTKKYREIPIEELSDDLKNSAEGAANLILNFCDNPEDLEKFRLRASVKAYLHLNTGKQFLVCYIYENEVSEIALGRLYKVNQLKAKVKRFKYKLDIVSDTYELMELHVDLNSKKAVADYKIFGKPKGETEWISIIDELNLEVMKAMNKK
ncbi:hypothetical protein [Aquimarina rubra]|uniref:DUF4468 domain-containing protein n=1 Tax=Aquimarina rubra TaxID=1920033 RepID=A0ABW5LKA2_9FLAO